MKSYDFIMAGGGMAGLSLAYQLVTGAFHDRSILIIDKVKKTRNDRTWCCWVNGSMPFDHIVSHRWSRIGFYTNDEQREIELSPYEYRMVRGIDFYEHVLGVLESSPQVEFLQSVVTSVENQENHALVHTEHGTYKTQWVFDSLFLPEEFGAQSDRYHYLMQHFRGWEIETPRPSFDPGIATLFDFRTRSENDMRFVYVLPYSETEALVEYTLFSAELLDAKAYDGGNRAYIEDVLGLREYTITHSEEGIIPMTDQPFPRRLGRRTMSIGTKGGRVKPSTGFAFLRTQRDNQRIVDSLSRTGSPFDVPPTPRAFATMDTMLLQVLYRRGDLSEQVFSRLFVNNPVQRVFRFLDEEASIGETIALMASVPWGPFIRAWIRTKLLGTV